MQHHGIGSGETVLDGLNTPSVSCAVLVVSESGQITSLNPLAAALLQWPADLALPRALDALPRPLQKAIQEVLTTHQPIPGRSITLPRDKAREYRLWVTPLVSRPETKNTFAAIAVWHDVTTTKRVEQNFLRVDRLASLGTLAASMAHEIKNALVAVKTFVDLLRQKEPNAELTDIAGREILRIDRIVSQMLKLAGPAKPSFVTLHAHEVLEHSLRLMQHQIEGKKVHLQRAFTAASDWIHGDEHQLQQAFINFLLNALEAMGPGGQLSVTTELVKPVAAAPPERKGPAYLRLRIQDTGVGVPPENLSRLFEPFFTTKPDGTGLGLPISRRIIEDHGGTVAVQSELNKGTLLSIQLPVHRKAP